MFKAYTSQAHLGSYLAGMGTAVLVVIVGWILLVALPAAAPVSLPSGIGDAAISTTPSTAIHPVDRKLVDEGYLAILMDRSELDLQTSVHPADRKFFSGNFANYSAPSTGTDPLASVDPADRKLVDEGYLAIVMNHENLDPLANVHPADRKFFGGSAMNFAASSTGANPLAHINPADRKLVDEGYLAILMDREIDAPASTNLANRRLSYEEYVEAMRQRDAISRK